MSSNIDVTPGTICGCDCGCRAPLNVGNVMGEDVTRDESDAEALLSYYETGSDARILLLICVECYTGNHQPRNP